MMMLSRKVSISKLDIRKYPDHKACPWKVDWYESLGRRCRRFFRTRSEALVFQSQKQQELAIGSVTDRGGNVSLSAAISAYLGQAVLARNTVYQYERILLEFGRICDCPDSGHWTSQFVLRYINKRLDPDHASPATINKELRTLKAFFNWAKSQAGLIEKSPFELLPIHKRTLKEYRSDPVTWTPEEFRRVLATLPTEEWRVFALLLVWAYPQSKAYRCRLGHQSVEKA